MKKSLSVVLILLFSLTGIMCENKKDDKANALMLIASHTSRLISQESAIRVIFHERMIPDDDVDQELLNSPFDISPSIEGKTKWTNARTLVFYPDENILAFGSGISG